MKPNTLVYHKESPSLGIGCVAKILKRKVIVNFGTEDSITLSPGKLKEIDTSKCKTITIQEFNSIIMSAESKVTQAIVGNVLKEYVGIGWITLRTITEDDLKKYKRVIE